jgi:hypothetical protein
VLLEDLLQFTSLAFDETVTAAEGISEVAIPWFLFLLLMAPCGSWLLLLGAYASLLLDIPAITAE